MRHASNNSNKITNNNNNNNNNNSSSNTNNNNNKNNKKLMAKIKKLSNLKMPFQKGVFNFLLKVSTEVDSLIGLGRAFHNLGAANANARSPRVALGLIFG